MFNEPFHKSSAFHYIIIILIIATLFVSGLVLLDVKQIKASLLPQTIDANDFLAKLTAHPEASSYVGISPLNIIQINTNNIDNLQAQLYL